MQVRQFVVCFVRLVRRLHLLLSFLWLKVDECFDSVALNPKSSVQVVGTRPEATLRGRIKCVGPRDGARGVCRVLMSRAFMRAGRKIKLDSGAGGSRTSSKGTEREGLAPPGRANSRRPDQAKIELVRGRVVQTTGRAKVEPIEGRAIRRLGHGKDELLKNRVVRRPGQPRTESAGRLDPSRE